MKLYFSPGACSFSPHVVLREAGLPFQIEKVDLKTHQTAGGVDFYAVNPKGYVPALQLDDGQVLTEGAAIVQYIADLKPESKLAPAAGTMGRYRLQEWLTFIATELHKAYSPLFKATNPDEVKLTQKDLIGRRLDYVAKHLADQQYLMGDAFTVADAYLFTILRWSKNVNMDLGKWPMLRPYMDRISARPAVAAAMEAERK
jgi:glutathione S-transferase